MPPEKLTGPVGAAPFLRSVNVQQDADFPDRVAHYRPTGKGTSIVRSLAALDEERAFLVIAPYGSGKSIAATYVLQLVENRVEAADALTSIHQRLRAVSADLGRFAETRLHDPECGGGVLALSGYQSSVAEALKDAALKSLGRLAMGRQARSLKSLPAATIQDGLALLSVLQGKARRFGLDRIAIVWDEFGQHVERLLSTGRHNDLLDVQVLAEFVTRQADPPITFGVLMHQDLLGYASNVSQSVRNEWAKIEGRFRAIQYVDDSPEVYRLLAELIAEQAPSRGTVDLPSMASASSALGLFKGFESTELAELLARAYPVEPAALHLLPRLSARVAQNERTLFSFVYEANLESPISPADLYDYFSRLMQVDGGIGGTQRRWLEAESAISKARDEDAERVLKTACLLNLGLSGERARAPLGLLEFAARGFGEEGDVETSIQLLIDDSLLLHRRHNDDVSVWHGTDLDLRGSLKERKARRRADFDLIDFLDREHPAPFWKPVRYNCEHGVQRYFEGTYVLATSLGAYVDRHLLDGGLPPGTDGRILYIVCESKEDFDDAIQKARSVEDPQLLFAVSDAGDSVHDAALEVQCLIEMHHDPEVTESDPLAHAELQQLMEDSRAYLGATLSRLTVPSSDGPRWYHAGEPVELSDASAVRSYLSDVMSGVFYQTPRLLNENVVRHRPTPTIINARKKLVLGILERAGQENLGIQGNFPDAAMFRSLLLNPGLYRESDDTPSNWRFAEPEELPDPALATVWTRIRDFVTKPEERPKQPSELLETLKSKPFGLREGVLPILLAAGLRAFPSAIAVMRDGEYLRDLLPTDIEELCREPARYRVVVFPPESTQRECLQQILEVFAEGSVQPEFGDIVRQAFDVLHAWKEQLAPEALKTRQLSKSARDFQRALGDPDPVRMLTTRFPSLMPDWGGASGLVAIKREIETSGRVHYASARSAVRSVLASGDDESVADALCRWASAFPAGFVQTLQIGIERRLLQTFTAKFPDEESLLDETATLLVQRPVHRWHDYTGMEFDLKLGGVVSRLERWLRSWACDATIDANARAKIARLIARRIDELESLAELIGQPNSAAILQLPAKR